MNKKFCHLLVGFSIYNYFKNLITSVLELDSISDIYVITTGNPKFFGMTVPPNKYLIKENNSKQIFDFMKKELNVWFYFV